MPEQRKVFRIEQMQARTILSNVESDIEVMNAMGDDAMRHLEIMTELKALRAILEQRSAAATSGSQDNRGSDGARQMQVGEVRRLKIELDVIGQAIQQTKDEIVTLQDKGFDGARVARVAHQLDAVVSGTEQATGKILKAAEDIDQMAGLLAASLKNSHEQGLAQDIQEQITYIFEACNFHDLTG